MRVAFLGTRLDFVLREKLDGGEQTEMVCGSWCVVSLQRVESRLSPNSGPGRRSLCDLPLHRGCPVEWNFFLAQLTLLLAGFSSPANCGAAGSKGLSSRRPLSVLCPIAWLR